jgi:hypothetical protein
MSGEQRGSVPGAKSVSPDFWGRLVQRRGISGQGALSDFAKGRGCLWVLTKGQMKMRRSWIVTRSIDLPLVAMHVTLTLVRA